MKKINEEIDKYIRDAEQKGIIFTVNSTGITTEPCSRCGKALPHHYYPLPQPYDHICMDCADELDCSELFRKK